MKTSTLKVPGAELYYEVRGSGPVLLLICGGVYDATAFAGLAGRMTDRYTVVTYDRRGNSRSALEGAREHQSIEVHGDDAHRLLLAVGVTAEEPACVFGNSSGAIIGLELVAKHPEQVRALVAHEPPLFDLLPDREHWREVIDEIEDTFAKEGAGPAGEVLGAALKMSGGEPAGEGEQDRIPGGAEAPQGEPDQETMEMMARIGSNLEFFIGYEIPPFSRYSPDFAAIKASAVRIVAAAGEASEGEPPYLAAIAVAERLGTTPVLFPGDHGGFGLEHEAFAAELAKVLAAS